jgi:peptidoglycan hydrolase-like protein with peptidoglycan-binding domain
VAAKARSKGHARSKRPKRRTRRSPQVVASAVGALVALAAVGGGLLIVREERVATDAAVTTSTTSTTVLATTTSTSTTTTEPPTTTTTVPPPMADGTLQHGEVGPEVADLQTRLVDLGFWLGSPDGTFGQLTRQAVMAFQKAQGLGRDGVAGPTTLAAVAAAARPAPREPSGTHLEIDLDRQILLVVEEGQTRWALNTSTGNGEAYRAPGGGTAVATTPTGSFTVYRQIDGRREAPLGTLYRPKYFTGGIAIHGSGSIPATPASHGCARVTNAAMDLLWSSGLAPLGTPVLVY